jgi:hypothetical protein
MRKISPAIYMPDAYLLNGVKMTFAHHIPRGQIITTTESTPPGYDYNFLPICVLNTEDYIDQARTLKCWDAALDGLKAFLRHRIDRGDFWPKQQTSKPKQ